MGCWNGTCGISNIHIRAGEEVVGFALNESVGDNLCYATGLFSPFLIPFYGHYDDYGGAENTHGVGLALMLDAIKRNLHEVPAGSNEYHEREISREAFNEDMFWRECHERRLRVTSRFNQGTSSAIQFVLIKKSVLDGLMERRTLSSYIKNSGTGLHEEIEYKFSDVLAGIPKVVAYLTAPVNDNDPLTSFRRILPFDLMAREMEANLTTYWLQRAGDQVGYSDCTFHLDAAIADPDNQDKLGEILRDYLIGAFVNSTLNGLRKLWSPQGGMGSQSGDTSEYRVLIQVMTDALDQDDRRYEDEDEDEDEE